MLAPPADQNHDFMKKSKRVSQATHFCQSLPNWHKLHLQKLPDEFLISKSVCPSQPVDIDGKPDKHCRRVFMHATFEPFGKKLRKFGTLIKDSVLILVTKFHAPPTLAPPVGQCWNVFMIL